MPTGITTISLACGCRRGIHEDALAAGRIPECREHGEYIAPPPTTRERTIYGFGLLVGLLLMLFQCVVCLALAAVIAAVGYVLQMNTKQAVSELFAAAFNPRLLFEGR